MDDDELLTIEDLEKRPPKFKANTWRLWLRQGRLPSLAVGRRVFVREADRVEFFRKHERGLPETERGTLAAVVMATPRRPKVSREEVTRSVRQTKGLRPRVANRRTP
jgi:hypothetical protein